MNTTEHLLTCLAEEAAELSQACAKALRFGLDDQYPVGDKSNQDKIAKEFNDVLAIMDMLQNGGWFTTKLNTKVVSNRLIAEKISRVRNWMEYSRARGMLRE